MGILKKLKKAAKTAGEVGKRLPTTEEIVFGKKPQKKRKRS